MKQVKKSLGQAAMQGLLLAALGSCIPTAKAADPFAENVRTTEPLTPEQQQKTFRLPPGFEMQLVASEPDLRKPMNMAFDARGRLWITESREYPYAAPLGKPSRDSIRVFEDFDANGRARKMSVFADGLNIPTGLYPYQGGAIGWSIPNIWHFRDTDGDGKADQREVLFGPLGWERDTHGMDSSFRRGFDGWLYMTHGYNNNSTVRGKDGSEITMNSGNVYRVRLDGSRVEQHTYGQVNPFGLCFDPLGNLYSADCHSAPIYQLLRGGYYPSFGKPHDGLGFAPTLMEHSHGSTAIAGIVYYDDDLWPAEFRDNMFIGNVMTSRVNRDHLVEHGSRKTAIEQPDFVVADDPWFRPVDIQLGPDGALYIADFYNRIIGHYEVPLAHPGRDRERGRIWRVVYKGDKGINPKAERLTKPLDISKFTAEELIVEMGKPNITRRMLAMNECVDRLGAKAVPALRKALAEANTTSWQKVHAMWALHRLGGVDEPTLLEASRAPEREVRVHAQKVLSETAQLSPALRQMALLGLLDREAFVQRAAADALGLHPAFENTQPLLALLRKRETLDDHLLHTVRMALRNQLRSGENMNRLAATALPEEDSKAIADLAVSIPSAEAAAFLLHRIETAPESNENLGRYLRHAARHIPENKIGGLADFARKRFKADVDLQLALFKSLQEGAAQRGLKLSPEATAWGGDLAGQLLAAASSAQVGWSAASAEGLPAGASPWFPQQRRSSDGDSGSIFMCSLPPGGERLTGVLKSPTFAIPAKLKFYLAGHDGYPDKPAKRKNLVRLRSAEDNKILAQAFPPRNDIAQPFAWDLPRLEGRQGYLEFVDGDNGDAYAWLAVGRFDPPVAPFPPVTPNQAGLRAQAGAELTGELKLANLEPELSRLLSQDTTDIETTVAAARALVALNPNENAAAMIPALNDAALPPELRKKISLTLTRGGGKDSAAVLLEAMKTAPYRIQTKLAQSLAGTAAGGTSLLDMAERKQVPAQLLLDRIVRDKLKSTQGPEAQARLAKLTENQTPASEAVQKLIDQRRVGYLDFTPSPPEGARIFAQTCSICHRIENQGSVVGPQLDGIGNRGLERLLEDILDPNRNVDRAFRTAIITLKDGEVVSGLPRREEGEVLVLADSMGKEISIPKKSIEARRESESSLMPENFGDILPREDFYHLMSYLQSKKANPTK